MSGRQAALPDHAEPKNGGLIGAAGGSSTIFCQPRELRMEGSSPMALRSVHRDVVELIHHVVLAVRLHDLHRDRRHVGCPEDQLSFWQIGGDRDEARIGFEPNLIVPCRLRATLAEVVLLLEFLGLRRNGYGHGGRRSKDEARDRRAENAKRQRAVDELRSPEVRAAACCSIICAFTWLYSMIDLPSKPNARRGRLRSGTSLPSLLGRVDAEQPLIGGGILDRAEIDVLRLVRSAEHRVVNPSLESAVERLYARVPLLPAGQAGDRRSSPRRAST